jgi:hypothetical protein
MKGGMSNRPQKRPGRNDPTASRYGLPWLKLDSRFHHHRKIGSLRRRLGKDACFDFLTILLLVNDHATVGDPSLSNGDQPTDVDWLTEELHMHSPEETLQLCEILAELQLICRESWQENKIVRVPSFAAWAAAAIDKREANSRGGRQSGGKSTRTHEEVVAKSASSQSSLISNSPPPEERRAEKTGGRGEEESEDEEEAADARRPSAKRPPTLPAPTASSSSSSSSTPSRRDVLAPAGGPCPARGGLGGTLPPSSAAPPSHGAPARKADRYSVRDAYNEFCEKNGLSEYRFTRNPDSFKGRDLKKLNDALAEYDDLAEWERAFSVAIHDRWVMGEKDGSVKFSFLFIASNMPGLIGGSFGGGGLPPAPPPLKLKAIPGPLGESPEDVRKRMDERRQRKQTGLM